MSELGTGAPIHMEYGLEDRPGPGRSLLFGFQHVLVMFTAMVAEPIVIGQLLKLPAALAVSGAVGVEADEPRLRGAISADGLTSAISALFGGSPLITYSQNVGLIEVTGVGSRHVVAWGGLVLLVMGFCPKFAALIAVTPKPVMGAALLVAWGLVVAVGTGIVRQGLRSERDTFIYAVSVALGLGIVVAPANSTTYLPQAVRLFFESGPSLGILCALVLNRTMNVTSGR